MALASSNTLLSVQRAGAHSVIATIPIGKSPVKINPITGNVYVASAVNRDDGTGL